MENIAESSFDHDDERYASFIRRAVAGIIDGLLIGTLGRLIGTMIFSPEDLKLVGFSGTLAWLYFAFMESSKQQGTIGKIFMKIKVTDLGGHKVSFLKASIRHFSKFLSAIILGIGYLMILWTDRRQGLHDIIAKTLVVKS